MKFIANILTDKKFVNNELYNVVSDKDKLIEDIPTLVIGWGYTKSMYPEASILNWSINKDVYWTYGKREKRNKYEENVEKFRKESIIRFIKSVKYTYYNLLTIDDEEKKYVIRLLSNESGTFVYINFDMVYIFDESTNSVVGISLRDIDYVGKDRKKMLSYIFKNKKNTIIDTKDSLSLETKIALKDCNYVIPYLYA